MADKLWPLLDGLRARGVARYEADGICVSFHESIPKGLGVAAGRRPSNAETSSAATPVRSDNSSPTGSMDEDLCTCGHAILTDHMPTGCVHGCAIETCGVPTGKALNGD